jgi:hypothetical protein
LLSGRLFIIELPARDKRGEAMQIRKMLSRIHVLRFTFAGLAGLIPPTLTNRVLEGCFTRRRRGIFERVAAGDFKGKNGADFVTS